MAPKSLWTRLLSYRVSLTLQTAKWTVARSTRWRNVSLGRSEGPSGAQIAPDYRGSIALAQLPRDRWGALGLWGDKDAGSAWTVPVTLPERCQLRINGSGLAGLRLEVGDEKFGLLSGFGRGRTGGSNSDSLDARVEWGSRRLAEPAGKTVRFHVVFTRSGAINPLSSLAQLPQEQSGNNTLVFSGTGGAIGSGASLQIVLSSGIVSTANPAGVADGIETVGGSIQFINNSQQTIQIVVKFVHNFSNASTVNDPAFEAAQTLTDVEYSLSQGGSPTSPCNSPLLVDDQQNSSAPPNDTPAPGGGMREDTVTLPPGETCSCNSLLQTSARAEAVLPTPTPTNTPTATATSTSTPTSTPTAPAATATPTGTPSAPPTDSIPTLDW